MVKIELTKSINFAGVAACGLLVCTVMTFTPAEAADTVDFTKLSGTWSGTETLYQKGQCSVGGRGRRHDSSQIRFALDVAVDGSFTLAYEPPGPDPQLALGRFNPDLSFTLAMPARAECQGVPREYRIDFVGKVILAKGRVKLKMEGLDNLCPDMECKFLTMISATRR